MEKKNNYIKDIILFLGCIIIVLTWIFYFSYFKNYENFKAYAIEKFFGIDPASVNKTVIIGGEDDALFNTADKQKLEHGEKININTATEQDFMLINGIGEVLAKRIVEYRTQKGQFSSIEDIKNVSGIGEKTYEKIYPYLSMDR